VACVVVGVVRVVGEVEENRILHFSKSDFA
jgi:hypothetical protein